MQYQVQEFLDNYNIIIIYDNDNFVQSSFLLNVLIDIQNQCLLITINSVIRIFFIFIKIIVLSCRFMNCYIINI
jgi:hypothetical protein